MEKNEQVKSEESSTMGAVAAGVSMAAIAGVGGSIMAGSKRFGPSAVAQARSQTERLIQQLPDELRRGMTDPSNLVDKNAIFELRKLQGDSDQVARLRTEHEYTRRIEAIAADNAKYIIEETEAASNYAKSRLKLFESQAEKWKASSILEKPLLGFKGASIRTKLGVIATAATLGIGTSWVLRATGSSEPKKTPQEVRKIPADTIAPTMR